MSLEDSESVVYSGSSNEGTWCQGSELRGFGATFLVQSQTLTGLTFQGSRGEAQRLLWQLPAPQVEAPG